MVSASQNPFPMGAFGKIPSRGDFITRGLPRSLTDRLDHWVREGLALARRNPSWHEAYLSSPVWQFAAARGFFDERPWCGVMMPSVDAVGRNFPLFIAASTDAADSVSLLRAQNHALEALVTENFSLESWQDNLGATASPGDTVMDLFAAPVSGAFFRVMSPGHVETARLFDEKLSASLLAKMINPTTEITRKGVAS